MTPTEQRILDFIKTHQDEHKCSPNAGQIAYNLGWYGETSGPANVRKYLSAMESKNIIAMGQRTRHISLLV